MFWSFFVCERNDARRHSTRRQPRSSGSVTSAAVFVENFDGAFRQGVQRVLHAFTDAAWYTATLPFDRGGPGLTRATDLRVAAYLGFVAAAAPELCAVMAASPRFLSAYLLKPSVAELCSGLPMGSQPPEHPRAGSPLDRLRRAHTIESLEEHVTG